MTAAVTKDYPARVIAALRGNDSAWVIAAKDDDPAEMAAEVTAKDDDPAKDAPGEESWSGASWTLLNLWG